MRGDRANTWTSGGGAGRRRCLICAAAAGLLLAGGCAALDHSPTGVLTRLERIEQRVTAVGSRVDQSTNNWDVWSLRLLVIGLVSLVVTYPLGKLLWLALRPVGRRVAGAAGGRP